MEIKFDVYFKKNLGTLFKSNEVDLDGILAHTNLDLKSVDRLEANYKVGTQKYTDSVGMVDIEERVIQIPFKSDVVKVGLNEFEIVAYMLNGDIKTSQTYTYNIEEGIGEGKQSGSGESSDGHAHSNLNILNSITQAKVNEWNNKADSTHSHSEYANYSHTHNASEIEGLENVDIDLSDYYTKSETYNKTEIDSKIANMGDGGSVDLSNYYTKSETDEAMNDKANKIHTHNEYLTELPTHTHSEYLKELPTHEHSEYLTELPSHEHEQYLTEHQDISHKADKSDIYTKFETDNKISEEIAKIELKEGIQGPKGDKGETGAVGPQGPQGEQGLKGDNGVTPNITIGTVTTLEPNQQATVIRRGTDANPIFDFGIPKGEKGEGSTGGNVSNNSSKVIFDYVYKDSRVIQPTSLDLATGIFTCDNVSFTGTCNIKLNTFSMNGVPKELGIHNNVTDIVKLSDTTFTIKCGGTNLTSYKVDSEIDVSTFCFTPPSGSITIENFGELENGVYTLRGFGTRGRAGQTIIYFLEEDERTIILSNGDFADGKPVMFLSFETKVHIQDNFKSFHNTAWVAHNNVSGTNKGFGFSVNPNTRVFNYTDKKITKVRFATAFNDGFRFILTKEV